MVSQDPTTELEAERRPYLFTLLRREGSGFGGFVARSYAASTSPGISRVHVVSNPVGDAIQGARPAMPENSRPIATSP